MLTTRDGTPTGLLLVLRRLSPGPELDHVLLLTEALSATDTPVVVAAEESGLAHEVARRGAQFIALPLESKARKVRANAGHIVKLLRERNLGLMHAHDELSLDAAAAAVEKSGVPLLVTAHRPFATAWSKGGRRQSALAHAGLVTATSQTVADHLRQACKVPAERLRLVRDGLDLAAFDPTKISGQRVIALARAWQLPDEHSVILVPALSDGRRALFAALEAVADLPYICALVPRYEEALDHDLSAVKADITRSGPAGRVFLAEPCRDMAAALKLADVVVMPGGEDVGFHRLLAEAQAMGRPAIAADIDGAAEQISDGETGFLVPPGAGDALGAALRHALCLSSIERQRLNVNSVFRAREFYDRKRTIEETLQIYHNLLQAQP